MRTTIIDEIYETLTISSEDNDTVMIVQKRRHCAADEWNTKIIVLNRREALHVQRALSQMLNVGVA